MTVVFIGDSPPTSLDKYEELSFFLMSRPTSCKIFEIIQRLIDRAYAEVINQQTARHGAPIQNHYIEVHYRRK